MKTIDFALRMAGTIFAAVAVIHLLRIVMGVSVIIGGWDFPLRMNLMGLVAASFLSGWLWSLTY